MTAGSNTTRQDSSRARARDVEILRSDVSVSNCVHGIESEILSHPSMAVLTTFGNHLSSRPLSREELVIFFASVGRFVLEIPPGIIFLASRVTDEWLTRTPFDALRKGARILFAAVDECGLNEPERGLLPTHHQLYADMAAHWNITDQELTDNRNIIDTGRTFARSIAEHYRERPICESLGFHLGVEATASIEFEWYLRAFQKFQKEYAIAHDDPMLEFLLVHLNVEESHKEMGIEMIELHTGGDEDAVERVRAGAMRFMEDYGTFFSQIDDLFFKRAASTNQ